jgi:hypothetical protein
MEHVFTCASACDTTRHAVRPGASLEPSVRSWNFFSGLLFSPELGQKDFRARCDE